MNFECTFNMQFCSKIYYLPNHNLNHLALFMDILCIILMIFYHKNMLQSFMNMLQHLFILFFYPLVPHMFYINILNQFQYFSNLMILNQRNNIIQLLLQSNICLHLIYNLYLCSLNHYNSMHKCHLKKYTWNLWSKINIL